MYVNSKDVAEVLGKRHDNLLRAIRNYITSLGDEAGEYFILDGEGRKATYNLTLKGCNLLAGRMIGKDGDEFRGWIGGVFKAEDPEPQEEPEVVEEIKEYTVPEVAEILGCSERNVYRTIQKGKLAMVEREVMVPQLRKFVPVKALEDYLAKKEGK